MKIISSGVTPTESRKASPAKSPVTSGQRLRKRTPIKSAEIDPVMTASSVLSLVAASCDELGEKLSLAIADKQFTGFEETAAKLVADLFSVSVSAERLGEDMNPIESEGE